MTNKKAVIPTLAATFIFSLILASCGNQAGGVSKSVSVSDGAALIEDIPTVQCFTDEAVSDEDILAIVNAGVNAPSSMNSQPWHFTVITDGDTIASLANGTNFGENKPGTTPDEFNLPNMPVSMTNMPVSMTMTDVPAGFSGAAPGNIGGEQPSGFPGGQPREMPVSMTDAPNGAPDSSQGTPGNPGNMIPLGTDSAKAGLGDAPLVIVVSCKEGSSLDAGIAVQNMSAEARLLGYGTKILTSPTMTLNGGMGESYRELLGIPDEMSVTCVLLVGRTDTENYDVTSSATSRNILEDMVTYIQ